MIDTFTSGRIGMLSRLNARRIWNSQMWNLLRLENAHFVVFVVIWLYIIWRNIPYMYADMPHFHVYNGVRKVRIPSKTRYLRRYEGPISARDIMVGKMISQSSRKHDQHGSVSYRIPLTPS